MRRHLVFQSGWYAINVLLAVSLLLLALAMAREYSNRRYLKGFADAVVPLSASAEQKVEAILAWMKHGPARRGTTEINSLAVRDPQDTLNYGQLLRVCGTATNAFVNLAASSGLPARRLLLLGPDQRARHVVAEVRLGDRWVVVDPAYRIMFRDAQAHPLTRQQLTDAGLLREAAEREVPNYPREYSFERTTHVRLARVPIVGPWLQTILDSRLPALEEAVNWTPALERESFAMTVLAALLVWFGLVSRLVLSWYGERRLGIIRVRLREQLLRAGATLFGSPQ